MSGLRLTMKAGLPRERRAAAPVFGRRVFQSDDAIGGSPPDRPLRREGRPLRVLVVEDEPLVTMDYTAIVADLGGEVVGATALAEEAVQLARELRPDVVVMDVGLDGDMDGIDAAHAIRSQRGAPVVFVTGRGDATTLRRIRELGAQSPMLKPVSAGRLCRAILDACRR